MYLAANDLNQLLYITLDFVSRQNFLMIYTLAARLNVTKRTEIKCTGMDTQKHSSKKKGSSCDEVELSVWHM